MKVKTIMPFKDKQDNKSRNPGDVFECTEERYKQIRKAGKFVVKVEEPAKSEKK